jgi:hypothetical protein
VKETMSKNRLPIIKQESDDFVMTFAGEEYKPHAGEAVWFIPYLSTTDTLTLLEMSEGLSDDVVEGLKAMRDGIFPIIVKIIDSWTWTSVITGEPLGMKDGSKYRPNAETIASLSTDEQSYLIGAYFKARGLAGGDEAAPDPQ